MNLDCLQLRRIAFSGPSKYSELTFDEGVNVICGASDTGKSFLSESIDFMLGGAELRDIPQRTAYQQVELDLEAGEGSWRFARGAAGGKYSLEDLTDSEVEVKSLKHKHAHNKIDNMSGFLLNEIGVIDKRILRSKLKGSTQSLSFRNLARLAIVQEDEIQQKGSPFWGGQYALRTPELATIKFLLTGVDDAEVIEVGEQVADTTKQIELLDELLGDLQEQIVGADDEHELKSQINKLEGTISCSEAELGDVQEELNQLLEERQVMVAKLTDLRGRLDDITDLLARFDLLSEHYEIDVERLEAIQESGAMFAYLAPTPCPLCGSSPDDQNHNGSCEADVALVVKAATAEVLKIQQLKRELNNTVTDLQLERSDLDQKVNQVGDEYDHINSWIEEIMKPTLMGERTTYSELIEKKVDVQRGLDLYHRIRELEDRKLNYELEESSTPENIVSGIPDSAAHALSLRISNILNAWEFPGDCHVHFDQKVTDFVIDGKPRGSRGKGLRAITHAAVNIALLEHCQECELPHPGFVVLDSPLLAYFKPEGDDEEQLKGSNLKQLFYQYLLDHHASNSQIIIIENQHPPEAVQSQLTMTVFTGNPSEGRAGFL